MGMNSFASGIKTNGCFAVQNVSPQMKRINIFQYPIDYMQTRDLLEIKGIGEMEIRASLLKGDLNFRLRAKDIIIICSDIDLLQFNINQQIFLQNAGIINGLSSSSELKDIALIGLINNTNTLFTIPTGTFIYAPPNYKIVIYWNGIKQYFNDDYILGPYSGGYNSVVMTVPPSPGDYLTADYYLQN